MARLDRLSAVKEVAQVGAAIGREFSNELLAAVLRLEPAELDSALARLTEADLVHYRGTPSNAIYSFKHALIQDAAYASMLRSRRQSLHARIAETLEARYPETASAEPEQLAHHFTEAGLLLKAIPYWQKAGAAAAARAAHTEACVHFSAGLELISRLPEDVTRNALELGLRVQSGLSLSATRGYAAPEVEAAYQRARELCRSVGDTADVYPVLRGLCTFYIVRDDLEAARELAERCVHLGEQTQRADYLIEGYTALGYTLAHMGELDVAATLLAKAVQTYRSNQGERLHYPTPQDPALASLCMLTITKWMLGDLRGALRYKQEALETAEALKRPFDLAYAHCYFAMFDNMRREYPSAASHAATTIEISQRHGYAVWLGAGTLHLAIAKGGLAEAAEAIELLSATLAAWHAAGAEANSCFFLAGLAESCCAAGKTEQALKTLDQAIDHAARHNEHFYDAALYRIRGELRALAGDGNAAAADLRHAVDIARRQGGAKQLELRAAASLHALCLENKQPEDSRAALEIVYNELAAQNVESRDLTDARALLGSYKPAGV